MGSQDAGADANLSTIALRRFELSFLLNDSKFNQLFDSSSLFKFYIRKIITFKQVWRADFRVDSIMFREVYIVSFHLMAVVFLHLFFLIIWCFCCWFHFKFGVIVDNFFIFIVVDLMFLRQFVGIAQQIVDIFFGKFYFLGFFLINKLCRVKAGYDRLISLRKVVLYRRMIENLNFKRTPHIILALLKRYFLLIIVLARQMLWIRSDIIPIYT